MPSKNIHDATGQLKGYLYQVLSALLLLMRANDNDTKVCIETIDDIAIVDDESGLQSIQVKHHENESVITDTSVDFWRTIKSWCDFISNKGDISEYKEIRFIILTTSEVKLDCGIFNLKENHRNTSDAYEKLLNIANNINKSNDSYYKAFRDLNEDDRKYLIDNIFIYDESPNLAKLEDKIRDEIKLATLPQYEDKILDKIVGWWVRMVLRCLNAKEKPAFISFAQVRVNLNDFISEYKVDSLPVDVDPLKIPSQDEIDSLAPEKRIFIKQLEMICLSEERLRRCIRDYYNAYQQRSQWIREELLYVDDLEKYENELVDEWELYFLEMRDKLKANKDIDDLDKQTAGLELFYTIEKLDKRIKEKVSQAFIMRGTYHELANRLKVGWHVDFYNQLYCLLNG